MTHLRHITAVLIAAVVILTAATAASGFWTAGGGGSGSAGVTTMSAPGTPVVPGSGVFNEVTLSWAAATVPGTGTVTYAVERSVQDSGTWTDAGGTCPTAAAPAATLSCSDAPASSRTYVYRVRAFWQSWTERSATSSTVTVVVDGTAPATIDNAPTGWINQDVSVTLSATDTGGSGIDRTYYTTDGSNPTTSSTTYSAPIAFSTPGTHTLKYRSRDRAGNLEAVRTATIRIDKSSPTVAFTFPEAAAAYTASTWTTGCSTAATDDFCGTAGDTGGSALTRVEVSIRRSSDGSYWNGTDFSATTESFHAATGTTSWSLPLPSSKLTNGVTYTISARSVDTATNASTIASRAFTFSAATCTEPTRTLSPSDLDTWIDQASPTANNGASSDLLVASETDSKNRRALVRFNIGTLPAGCKVTDATLTLTATAGSSSVRTLEAYRAGATWTETSSPGWPGPSLAGSAATTASASMISAPTAVSWRTGVAPLVQAMFTSGNFGFVIKDQSENNATRAEQKFTSREHGGTKPRLEITFGPA